MIRHKNRTRIVVAILLLSLMIPCMVQAEVTQEQAKKAIEWAESKIGLHDWDGKCAKFVRLAFEQAGISKIGSIEDATAAGDAWLSHPGDKNPPRGAVVFWSGGDADNNGHIAISLGGGKIINTSGNGGVKVQDLYYDITTNGYALKYRGWGYYGDFSYGKSGGVVTITHYFGRGGDIKIPPEIEGLPVMSIGEKAFYQNAVIDAVTLPEGLTKIEGYAFAESSITSVNLPSSIRRIERGAFANCSQLASPINLPDGFIYLGDAAFQGCTRIKSLRLPNGLLHIPDNTFNGCGMEKLNIPSTVQTIGSFAFAYNNRLREVMIPASVQKMGGGAFGGCTNLERVEIQHGLKKIEWVCFSDCQNLNSINIPESVTSIEGGAFTRTSLTVLDIPASVASIGENAFGECEQLTTLSVFGRETKYLNPGLYNTSRLTLRGYTSSTTEVYAFEHGIPFRALDSKNVVVGDSNKDNQIDIKDLTHLIDCMVGQKKPASLANTDINGDGKIDINDMMHLIGLILPF
jgi:hypothetical protein